MEILHTAKTIIAIIFVGMCLLGILAFAHAISHAVSEEELLKQRQEERDKEYRRSEAQKRIKGF